MLTFVVSCLYYAFVRRIMKWLLTKLTGRCELLRITMSEKRPGPRTVNIESSLKLSRYQQLNSIPVLLDVDVNDSVGKILTIKKVDVRLYPEFPISLKLSISQIVGYRILMADVDALRKVQYSSDNAEHEAFLQQLWMRLQPDVVLTARVSQQWTDIGFQGSDPATDFRGMGLLGLQNLVYLSTQYTNIARKLLLRSHHPQFGYSFAIVGINLTSVANRLLQSGQLRPHFYNAVLGPPHLADFHKVYVYLFYEFDKFWYAEKPENIMQFNSVLTKFEDNLSLCLELPTTELKLDFVVC